MLEFIREEISGNLVAHSKTTPFKTYWVDVDSAWIYLEVVHGCKGGVRIEKPLSFKSTGEAIAAAQDLEGEA